MSTQETPARHRSQIPIPAQPLPSTIGPAFKRPDLVATGTSELEQKVPQSPLVFARTDRRCDGLEHQPVS
jgi:hypothetical protein